MQDRRTPSIYLSLGYASSIYHICTVQLPETAVSLSSCCITIILIYLLLEGLSGPKIKWA
jgi:hypothetical protein